MSDISDEQTAGPVAPSVAILPKLINALRETGEDAPVYFFVGTYALVVYALSVFLHEGKAYQPLMYLLAWTFFSLIFLSAILAVHATRTDPRRPFSALLVIVRQHLNRDSVLGVPLILATGIFYGVFTSSKIMLPDIHAYDWDRVLADFDYRLLGGHDGWRVAALLIPDGVPIRIIDIVYTKVWLFFVLGVGAYVAVAPDFRHVRRRFLLAFFLSWSFAGNILACVFMSGGPCFYGRFTPDHLRFAELQHSIAGTGSAIEQNYLWHAYANHEPWLGSGISAFPSVHLVAVALLTFLLGHVHSRLFWIGVGLTALMEIGSVRLGWHYVTDGVAGVTIAAISWHLAGIAERYWLKRYSARNIGIISSR